MSRYFLICTLVSMTFITTSCGSHGLPTKTRTSLTQTMQPEDFFSILQGVLGEWEFANQAATHFYPNKDDEKQWGEALSKALGTTVVAKNNTKLSPRVQKLQKKSCLTTHKSQSNSKGRLESVVELKGVKCPIAYKNQTEITREKGIGLKQTIAYKGSKTKKRVRDFSIDFSKIQSLQKSKKIATIKTQAEMTGHVNTNVGKHYEVSSEYETTKAVGSQGESQVTHFSVVGEGSHGTLQLTADTKNRSWLYNGKPVSSEWMKKHAGGELVYLPWGWMAPLE